MARGKPGMFLLSQSWSISDEKPVKIDKWDGSAVKNTLDDALRKVFTKHFKFVENHTVVDTRLILCTIACLFAICALVYDYFIPFPNSRPVLILCVLLYFFLMGVLTVFTSFTEKNYVVFAVEKDKAGMGPNNSWDARSTLRRYDDMFELTISYQDGETKKKEEDTLRKSVSSWFDEDGVLLFEEFLNDVVEICKNLKKEKAQ